MTSILSILKNRFSGAILNTVEFRGEQTVIAEKARAKEIIKYCRDELGFDYLIDISSIDHLGEEPRWEIVYELYALGNGARHHLRIKYKLVESDKADSVSDIWPTAGWHEREI